MALIALTIGKTGNETPLYQFSQTVLRQQTCSAAFLALVITIPILNQTKMYSSPDPNTGIVLRKMFMQ